MVSTREQLAIDTNVEDSNKHALHRDEDLTSLWELMGDPASIVRDFEAEDAEEISESKSAEERTNK